MAVGDVYELGWATQYDGATSINTLYYRQNLSVVGQEETKLIEDFFGLLNGPWEKLRLQLHEDAVLPCAAAKRVADTIGLQVDATLDDRSGLKDGPGLPSHNAVQFSWYAEDEFGEEVTNRLFLMGFDTDIFNDYYYSTAFIDWAADFAKTIQVFGTTDSPSSDTWYLQHRTNTGGLASAIFYDDSEEPFLRPWITRQTNRRPIKCS